jgi:AcrR family transcriptional regulator
MAEVLQKAERRSQAERSATTSALIIQATIQCLYERGYAATSTTLVARYAGVSRGAMLHHFATKVALMSSTVQETYASDILAYTDALNNISFGEDRIEKLIDTAWACFRSPGGVAQTEIWMASRSDPELAAAVLPVHAAIDKRSVRALAYVLGHYDYPEDVTLESFLCYLVSSLRGLSIQHILGNPEAELAASVGLIKVTARTLVREPQPSETKITA